MGSHRFDIVECAQFWQASRGFKSHYFFLGRFKNSSKEVFFEITARNWLRIFLVFIGIFFYLLNFLVWIRYFNFFLRFKWTLMRTSFAVFFTLVLDWLFLSTEDRGSNFNCLRKSLFDINFCFSRAIIFNSWLNCNLVTFGSTLVWWTCSFDLN